MIIHLSLHGIIGLCTILLIWITGIRAFIQYKKTKIPSLLLFSFTFFTGGFTYLTAIIPSFLRAPELFSPLFAIGTIPLAFGIAAYLAMISKFIPMLAPWKNIIFIGLVALGLLTAFTVYKLPMELTFTEEGWTSFQYPPLVRVLFLTFLSISMLAGGTTFFVRGIKVTDEAIRERAVLNGIGFFLLAVGIFLAVFGEAILYNFLFLMGYLLIFARVSSEDRTI